MRNKRKQIQKQLALEQTKELHHTSAPLVAVPKRKSRVIGNFMEEDFIRMQMELLQLKQDKYESHEGPDRHIHTYLIQKCGSCSGSHLW